MIFILFSQYTIIIIRKKSKFEFHLKKTYQFYSLISIPHLKFINIRKKKHFFLKKVKKRESLANPFW